MKNKIIVLSIILLFIALIGILVYGGENKVDAKIPTINTHLKSGDSEYNSAVTSLNNKKYSDAQTSSENALNEFKKAKETAQDALISSTDGNNTVIQKYIQDTISEIDLKISATNELSSGIRSVSTNPSEANQHFTKSNDLMKQSLEIKTQRKQTEKENPSIFQNIN
ncbi:MAG: hypothetical protein Q4Q23_04315 [Methanobacteriaceae archaeon]|nr:hypothetical protein [Methanobacteriaceae archaeon]